MSTQGLVNHFSAPITQAQADDDRVNRDFVQSLERGLQVIRCFTADRPDLSVTEVAERTHISRAAARRILVTLEQLGYVARNQAGLFHLQPAILTLGYAYLSGQQLPQVARPFLQEVARQLQGSSSLGVLDGADVLFVARAGSPSLLTTSLSVGSRLPAHVTAMGRVLLAELPDEQIDRYLTDLKVERRTHLTLTEPARIKKAILDARREGYSFVDQELALGIRAVAVPVYDGAGAVVASINVSVADSRAKPGEVLRRCLPVLRQAATRISTGLLPT